MARYQYHGDINCRCGGYFVNKSDWRKYGYADVVRIQPVSDAGGPDNQFWIARLAVNLPTGKSQLVSALECSGFTFNGRDIVGNGLTVKPRTALYDDVVIDCLLSYGYYDQDSYQVVQIGKKPDEYCSGGFGPLCGVDYVLRAGSSLRNFVRREFLKG